MDVANVNSWISQPDVCRCCLSASGTWDLKASYITEAGIKEVFSDMLLECYGISLSYLTEWGPSRLVCAICAGHLRDAAGFKKQVLQAERRFMEYYDCKKEPVHESLIKIEPELESHSPEDYADGEVPNDAGKIQRPEEKDFKIEYWAPQTKSQNDMTDGMRDTYSSLPKTEQSTLINKTHTRKRHKHVKATAKVKEKEDSEGDSDTPISELKMSQIEETHQNMDLSYTLGIPETDATKFSSRTPRVTPGSYLENRHLRSNITLLLKNSTIIPFKHVNKYRYTCLYCDHSYLFFKHLKTHLNDQHNNVTEKEILRSLKTPKNLIKAEVSDIKCKLCDSIYKTVDNLIDHLIKTHNKVYYNTPMFKPSHGILGFDLTSEKFQCHICHKEFRFFKNLSMHMNEHSANFVCHFCGKKFLSNHRLHAHVKMHKETNLKCKFCDKEFRTTSARGYHVRKIHSEADFKCPECDEVFPHYQKRIQHLVDVHKIKKPEYKCNICSKNYASSGGLSAHIQYSHLKNKEYPCDICGKNFGYKWTLKKHLIVHSGVKNFECKFCSKKFGELYTLKVHMRIHLNDKPYACAVCKAAFIQKCSLKNITG